MPHLPVDPELAAIQQAQIASQQAAYAASNHPGSCWQLNNGQITRDGFIAQLIASGYNQEVAIAAADYCQANPHIGIAPSGQSQFTQQDSATGEQAGEVIAQEQGGHWEPSQRDDSRPGYKEMIWVPDASNIIPDFPPTDIITPIPETISGLCETGTVSIPSSSSTTITDLEQSCPEEIQYCRNVYTAVGELFSEIETAILESIRTEITQAAQPITHIENVMIGQIQVNLNGCESQLGKCHDKVMRPIRNALGECYGYLSQCGCCYPTAEQVVYGLQTGNYMESVGLTSSNMLIQTHDGDSHGPQMQVQNVTNLGNICEMQESIPSQTATATPASTPRTFPEPPTPEKISTMTREELEALITLTITGLTAPPQLPTETPQPTVPDVRESPGTANPFRTPFWDSEKVCELIKNAPGQTPNREQFGFYLRPDGRHSPRWWLDLWGFPPDGSTKGWSWLRKESEMALWRIMHGLSDASEPLMQALMNIAACDRLAIDGILLKIATGFISHWTQGSLDGILKGMEYKVNQSCPQQIPSQSELNAMRLSNQITPEYWKCLTEANNNLPLLQERVVSTGRTKLDFDSALKLYRLGRLGNTPQENETNFSYWAQENGVISTQDRLAIESGKIDIPTVSDLIRMMVRDVGDPNAIKKYDLHAEFDQKWQGNLATFGSAQGIDPEIAKLHWAAHWDQPSNTQVFEMLHRLRPDNPDVQALDQQSKAKGGKGVVTTIDDVKDLLAINDMLPYWRDRFVAISYHPLTRTDAQRAFQLGALGATQQENEAKLQSIYQDLGYTEDDAKILVQFTKKQTLERKMRAALPKGVNKAIGYYLQGIHTINQLEDYLNFLKVPVEKQADILKYAADERKMILYKNAIGCIRLSYMQGALDDVDAHKALVNEGMDAALARQNINDWWCKKKVKLRVVTAAKLCEWREKRLINAEDHLRRLVNLGYKLEDAKKIVQECEMDINQKAYNKLIAELKKQQANAEKEQKEAEKAQNRAFRAQQQASKNGK